MIRTVSALSLAAVLLAACGSGGSDSSKTPPEKTAAAPAATSAPVPTTSAPTTPAVTTYQLKKELKADVLTASVLEYKMGFDAIGPDTRSDAILVRMCNIGLSAEDSEFILSSITWSLLDDDEGRFSDIYSTSGPGNPQPAFPEAKVPAGKCVKGWILMSLPTETNIVSAAFAPNDEDLGYWDLGS